MKSETATKVSYSVMGLIFGVAVTMMISFKGGYLVTQAASEQMVNAAVLATRAEICVAQFRKDPHYQARLKEFKELNFLARDAFIEKWGWDRMPGEEKTRAGVNRLCGDRLAALAGK